MNDEEIIIEPLNCAFCFKDLGFLPLAQREAHYEEHFLNDIVDNAEGRDRKTPVALASSSKSISTTKSPNRILDFVKERDIFWYPEQTIPPPSNYTPGLILLIHKGLLKGQSRQLIRRAVLCNQKVVHIHREAWDAGFGCGYRNFVMACAALMCQEQQPLYFPLLDTPLPPSVRNLQSWIESAWKDGFDPEGHKELKKLVGTSRWVGTADLWVAFSYRGIPAELVDFDLRTNSQGVQILINWIVDYFSVKETIDARPKNAFECMKIPQITITEKMPIILQHNGHSRSIIGYEIDKNGVLHLLTFDPSFRPPAGLRTASLNEFAQHRSSTQRLAGASNSSNLNSKYDIDSYAITRKFRLDTEKLSKKKEYQILYFPMTAPLTDEEKRRRKTVTSTKIC